MAITEYCTVAQLESLGMGGGAFRNKPFSDKQGAIATASVFIDSYLRNQYTLPLQTAGVDLARCCAIIACYHLLFSRGFDPSSDGNDVIGDEYARQISWLKDIQSGKAAPAVTDSASPTKEFGAGPRVVTSSTRGYRSSNTTGGRRPFTRD